MIPHRLQLIDALLKQYFPDCNIEYDHLNDMEFNIKISAKREGQG